MEATFLERIDKLCLEHRHEVACEVCIGAGRMLRELRSWWNGLVVGVDWSIQLLSQALAESSGDIVGVCSDWGFIGLRSSSVAVAFVANMLKHVCTDERARLLAEVGRIVKAAGVLVVIEACSGTEYATSAKGRMEILEAQVDQGLGRVPEKVLTAEECMASVSSCPKLTLVDNLIVHDLREISVESLSTWICHMDAQRQLLPLSEQRHEVGEAVQRLREEFLALDRSYPRQVVLILQKDPEEELRSLPM